MGGINRGGLLVDIHGAWRPCTQTIPVGSQSLGTVTHGSDTGALVRMPTGSMVLVVAGCCSQLDQSKVAAGLAVANDISPVGIAPVESNPRAP